MRPTPGQRIGGKYRLVRRIAEGGMAAVWLAEDEVLGRSVAVKFALDPRTARSSERLAIEARAAASLSHPHVVHVYDFGYEEEQPYLVMEFLEGEDLGAHLDRVGALSLERALAWTTQIAEGLRAVHDAGYIHRDVKPRNVFVEGEGDRLKLLDFGIVRTSTAASSELTEDGLVLGSAPYMSPEQARGQPLEASSDLWSLAAIFYRMLTGVSPFEAPHSTDSLIRVCTERAQPPSRLVPTLPPDVDAFFERALSTNAASRPRSVDEFLGMLDGLSKAPPRESRARGASKGALDSKTTPDSKPPLGRESETEPLPAVLPPSKSRTERRRWLLAVFLGAGGFGTAAALLGPRPSEPSTALRSPSEHEATPGTLVPARASTTPSEPSPELSGAPEPAPTVVGSTSPRPLSLSAPPRTNRPPGDAKGSSKSPPAPSLDPVFGLPVSSP